MHSLRTLFVGQKLILAQVIIIIIIIQLLKHWFVSSEENDNWHGLSYDYR